MRYCVPFCYLWPPDQDPPALQYQEPLTQPQYCIPEDLNPQVKSIKLVTFDILTAVAMNNTVFLDATVGNLVDIYQQSGGTCCLYLQDPEIWPDYMESHTHELFSSKSLPWELRNPWYCPFVRWLSCFISNHKHVPHICQTPPNSLSHISVPSYHRLLCSWDFNDQWILVVKFIFSYPAINIHLSDVSGQDIKINNRE